MWYMINIIIYRTGFSFLIYAPRTILLNTKSQFQMCMQTTANKDPYICYKK